MISGASIGAVEVSSGIATPAITWSTPAAITYGIPLGSTQLNASSSIPGTFTYTPGAGTLLNAGVQTVNVTFTPNDTQKYTTATSAVSLTVNKANPIVTWDVPIPIHYGSWLSSTALSAIANVPGSFVYSPNAGSYIGQPQVSGSGSMALSLTFTPTDQSNYNTVTQSNTVTVIKGYPAMNWSMPAAVVADTALSGTQLNATTSFGQQGTLHYSPDLGTIMTIRCPCIYLPA